jgi:hypothetical protein
VADDTGGLGGLFGEPAPAPAHVPGTSQSSATSVGGPGDRDAGGGWNGGWAAASAPPPPPAAPPRRRIALIVAAALVLVVVLGVGGWLLLRGADSGAGATAPVAATTPGATATGSGTAPATGATVQVGGVTYTMEVGTVDRSCRQHAYGTVADFFSSQNCVGVSRALWSAEVDGQPAVVALSRVVMPDAAAAQALRALTDGNGTGNVSDLLREGVRYGGAPGKLSDAEYASALDGATVTIVETSWSAAGPGTAAELNVLASNALTLPAAAVPDRPGN